MGEHEVRLPVAVEVGGRRAHHWGELSLGWEGLEGELRLAIIHENPGLWGRHLEAHRAVEASAVDLDQVGGGEVVVTFEALSDRGHRLACS